MSPTNEATTGTIGIENQIRVPTTPMHSTAAIQLITTFRPATRVMPSRYDRRCRARDRNAGNDPTMTADQPFVAPAVSPPTMYRCRNRNRIITGIAAITAPAENADQSA